MSSCICKLSIFLAAHVNVYIFNLILMKICYFLPWSQPSLDLIIPPACLGSITVSHSKFTQKIQTLEKCSELWATCINIKLVFFLVLHSLWPSSILHAQGVVSYCCWFSSKCYAGPGLVSTAFSNDLVTVHVYKWCRNWR